MDITASSDSKLLLQCKCPYRKKLEFEGSEPGLMTKGPVIDRLTRGLSAPGFCFATNHEDEDHTMRPSSTSHAGPRRPPNNLHSSVPKLLSVALASTFLGFGLAKPSSLFPDATNTDRNTTFGSPEDIKTAIHELRTVLAEAQVSTDPGDLQVHGFSSNDHHQGIAHSVIVYPESTEDVVKIVKIATTYRIPITAYSGGDESRGSLSRRILICVDMSNMDKILAIHEADSDLVCQPGIRWVEMNETLKEKGIPLFFPIDPAPGAMIGGMMSTGCSGTNAVRYGTAKGEWFLNATIVLPSGEVIKTRRRSRKSSAGFDTTKLFIGAEGTLGIITEVTIRLTPVLPTTVAVVQFPNVQKATEAVVDVMNTGVGIQCVELVDDMFMSATNKHGMSKRKWPEKDSLFFKFQGPTPASLKETAAIVRKIMEKHGGTGFQLARNDEEATELWADRKNAHYAGLALIQDAQAWPTDVCVPVSKLPELIYDTKRDIANVGLISTITEEEKQKAKDVVRRMVKRAISLDGTYSNPVVITCTGEHGVGIGKKEYLVEELGEGTVKLMKTIKKAIDLLGIFNPGKLYPDDTDHTAKDNKGGDGHR
ncbi:hypothetical protein M413DRAFT_7415 [Hebeloma cylindrosporum]|uniref:D-lactate dehydrogenase (cytochrome) n=1 Tax=Hebeloma cylindrosporum TaxID=76867 RepID=A0A0C2Z0A8_HEBCY|nr:hypothetical protein M413DRAFT_7415 [Hebeloma cylindrosporum h7]